MPSQVVMQKREKEFREGITQALQENTNQLALVLDRLSALEALVGVLSRKEASDVKPKSKAAK
jgi:hypothetical protein